MSEVRVDLTWSPEESQRRSRRTAAMTVVVLAGLLWALSRAETPGVPPTAPVPSLALSAANVNFGDLIVGTTARRPIVFRNDGTKPFTAKRVVFPGGNAAAFEVSLQSCNRIAPGKRCTALAVFRPTEAREEGAQIALLDLSGAQSPAVQLSGRGIQPTATQTVAPSLSLSAASIDFGDLPVGSAARQPIAFSNEGTAPFAASSIVFAGERAAAFEIDLGDCRNVAPRTPCTAVATFRPAEVREEIAQVALLEVSGARSAAATLSGRGTQPPPPPAPKPPPWHHVGFDTALVELKQGGATSIVVRNSGEDEAEIGAVKVDDSNSFRADAGNCGKLPPGGTCVARVMALGDKRRSVSNLNLYNIKGQLEDTAAVINVPVQNNPPVTNNIVPGITRRKP